MSKESKHLSGTSLVGGSVNYERVANDYYATDPGSTFALFDVVDFEDNSSFLEPCCGEGHISKIIKYKFPASDVESTDLIDRGFGQGGVDFLEKKYGDKKYDYIITNPPYKLAQKFIEKSLSITNNKVVMFLKIQFLEGVGRYDMFKNTPLKEVHVFSGRQDPWSNGLKLNPKTGKKWGSTMCFAWFVWEQGYEGEPIIKWIHPSKCKVDNDFILDDEKYLPFTKDVYLTEKEPNKSPDIETLNEDDFWN